MKKDKAKAAVSQAPLLMNKVSFEVQTKLYNKHVITVV